MKNEKTDQTNIPTKPAELTEDQLKSVAGGDKKTSSKASVSEIAVTRDNDVATPKLF